MSDGGVWPVYIALFLGLPVAGIWLYVRLCRRMAARGVPAAPEVRLLAVFAAYGALLLFGVSGVFDVWSAMHSLAAAVLVAVGTPWLVVQGLVTLLRGAPTAYHRVVAALSLAFPAVLVGCWLALGPGR